MQAVGSGAERYFAPGGDVFLNSIGGVGIGTTAVSGGLLLDVEGNIGAVQFCDNEGINCITIADVISGEISGLQGVIVDGGLRISGNNVGMITSGCLDGYIMQYQSGAWECVDSSGMGGGGGLDGFSCTNGQVVKYISGTWQCADDNSGGGDLSSFSCTEGEIVKYVSGIWQCAPDGIGASANLSCASGEVAKSNGSDWECAADEVSAPGGGDLSSIVCTNGQVVKYIGGTWQCADDNSGGDLSSIVCTNGQVVKYISGTWQCADDNSGGGKFTDGTNPSDAVYTAGNVGVGTSSPSAKLEVQGGSIKATDGLIIEVRTSDPSGPELVDGRMWLRSDL
jgi:hypothetical protein